MLGTDSVSLNPDAILYGKRREDLEREKELQNTRIIKEKEMKYMHAKGTPDLEVIREERHEVASISSKASKGFEEMVQRDVDPRKRKLEEMMKSQ